MPIYCTWPISVTGYERNHFESSIKILYSLWIVFLTVGVEMWMVSKDFFYFLILSAALKAKIMWSTFLLLSETRSSRIFFSLFFKSYDSPKYINHCITSYFSLKNNCQGFSFNFGQTTLYLIALGQIHIEFLKWAPRCLHTWENTRFPASSFTWVLKVSILLMTYNENDPFKRNVLLLLWAGGILGDWTV